MQRALALATVVVVSSLAFGCSKDSGGASGTTGSTASAVKGSCNNGAKGFCNEFLGSSFTPEAVALACKAQSVPMVAGPCPTDKLVGSCHVYAGQPMDSMYRYYATFPGGAAAAEKQCKDLLKGQWQKP